MPDVISTCRVAVLRFSVIGLATLACVATAYGHGPADHEHVVELPADDSISHVRLVERGELSGQGSMIFSWNKTLTAALPEAAKQHERGMHGGFTEDPATGIVYTGIKGYGLCSISPDLTSWQLISDAPICKMNLHGLDFFVHKGKKYLAAAHQGDKWNGDAGKRYDGHVVVMELDGTVVNKIERPLGSELEFAAANEYYGDKQNTFNPTDVAYLDGTIYLTDGYSNGNFILSLRETDGDWALAPLAWGGKGKQPGQFMTAHGITAHERHLWAVSRETHKAMQFTPQGKLVAELPAVPQGSRLCNIDFQEGNIWLCPLAPIGDQKSAPIYAHTGEDLESTIIPGDLGIPALKHIHHAWPHEVVNPDGTKRLHLLVHGWNPGKFVVLTHEPNARVAMPKSRMAAGGIEQ